jgi:cyanophycinase
MRTVRRTIVAVVIVASSNTPLAAQKAAGPSAGTLIVDGGGATEPIVRRFIEIAGGRQAQIVVFATGPSAIRFGGEKTILNPDWPRSRKEWGAYEVYLKRWLDIEGVQVLHTRDRAVANSDAFLAPLKSATGVYLVAGNAGRYADAYLGTRTQTELMAVLARGGVMFGSSAGQAASHGAGSYHWFRLPDQRCHQSASDIGSTRRRTRECGRCAPSRSRHRHRR